MKRCATVALFFLVIGFIGFFVNNCGKPAPKTRDQVLDEIMTSFNRMPAQQFQIDRSQSEVTAMADGRYRVVLRDSTLTTDLTSMAKSIANLFAPHEKEDAYSELDTATIDEVVFLYDPEKKYIQDSTMKGLRIEKDFTINSNDGEPRELPPGQITHIYVSLDKWQIKDLPRTHPQKEAKKTFPRRSSYWFGGTKDNPFESTMENFEIAITTNKGFTGVPETFTLGINKIESIDRGNEDQLASEYLFNKNAPPPDLRETLQKNLTLGEFTASIKNLEISYKTNGFLLASGSIRQLSYSHFFRPDKDQKYFEMGGALELKNLDLSFVFFKNLEKMSRLSDFRVSSTIEHLDSKAALALLKGLKTFMGMVDGADTPQLDQEVLVQAMMTLAEVTRSKFIFKLELAPFKHYFGEMEARIDFQLVSLLSLPKIQIEVNFFHIDNILKKITESGLFAPRAIEEIQDVVDKYTVRRADGSAGIDIRISPEHPDKYFLNSHPIPIKRKKPFSLLQR